MMRILIMVDKLTGGGAERVAALWTVGFFERGYDVAVVLNSKKSTPHTYRIPESVPIFNVKGNVAISWIASKIYRKFHWDWYYVRRLRKISKQFNPDIAIAVLRPWAGWMWKAAGSRHINIINTEHNSFERPEQVPLKNDEYKEKYILNKRYAYVTVLTEADHICLKGILDNVSVMPNPLAFDPVRVLPHKSKIILAAGRLDAWHYKGFDILLRAWGLICRNYPDWALQIAGYGSIKSARYLEKIALEAGAEKQVSFLGYCHDMLPLYQKSSIFVLSSRYEGFGMVLIEAMSQGCAPIACDYKGRQREIVTSDKEGVVCLVDNVESLSAAISRVIEDDNYRKEIQWNAVKRSSFYSLHNTMDRWDDILDKFTT